MELRGYSNSMEMIWSMARVTYTLKGSKDWHSGTQTTGTLSYMNFSHVDRMLALSTQSRELSTNQRMNMSTSAQFYDTFVRAQLL